MKYRIKTSIAVLLSIGLWHSVAFAGPTGERFKGTILELLLRTDGAQALAAAVEVGDEAACLPGIASTLDDKKARLVVFAPSNSAFEKFLRLTPNALVGLRIDEIKAQLQQLLNSVELTETDLCEVLLNHVAVVDSKPQDSSADDLLARGSITVAAGKQFPISVGTGGVFVNYEVTIVKQALARNGAVLYVDDVIQDPSPPGDNVVTIFATAGFRGNFGGLAGADAECQSRAETSGLGGTSWTAWLSDSTSDAIDRIPDGEYRLVDGTLVADDKADLTDGMLKVPLNQTQYGSEAAGNVWTGTGPDGRSTGTNCSNWTTQNSTSGCVAGDPECGNFGATNQTDGKWTEMTGNVGQKRYLSCGSSLLIYCFGILD